MDYDLVRVDYFIAGITYPDTLKVLISLGPKAQQKIVVGDKNGILQCITLKDEEPIVNFRTLPGKSITSVQITSAESGEKIFAASGNEVKGYSKKGKVFLAIETALAETITSMCILGNDLILGSGRAVIHYRDLKEIFSYVCDDRVLDLAAFDTPNSTKVRILALVANKGAMVMENGQIIVRAVVPSGPTRLAVFPLLHSSDVNAFFGAADGSIGLIVYEQPLLSSKCLVEGKGLGSVVCLGWFSNSSGEHVAVGRHDGSVQLYLLDADNLTEKPRLQFTYFCGEPVTSVSGGCVASGEPELVAATFSGRVFALRSKRLMSGGLALGNISQDAFLLRKKKLEEEVAKLEKLAANERVKYQRNTRSVQSGVSAPPLLDLQHELSGAKSDGWQELRITSATPLDMLFVYSTEPLRLLTDNAAVLSICPSQGIAEELLATVRCQAGTRRLWLKMQTVKTWTDPATSAEILIYAMPSGAPRVARLISLHLPILSFYSQHEDPLVETQNRSWCWLRLAGSFSAAQMSAWLARALPGEPPRAAQEVVLARRHALLRTLLVCRYQKGSATFKSDNVSTIAVLKDIMSNCSVKKGIPLEISLDIPSNCCSKAFDNLEKLFLVEYQKHRDIELYKVLRSLDLDQKVVNEESLLCDEYLRVWQSLSNLEIESYFNELVDTIQQWYTDWQILTHGKQNNVSIKKLRDMLIDCKINDIKTFFNSTC